MKIKMIEINIKLSFSRELIIFREYLFALFALLISKAESVSQKSTNEKIAELHQTIKDITADIH